MLAFPISKKNAVKNECHEAWRRFCENRLELTLSKEYKSLLELLLEKHDSNLYARFCQIREYMNGIYEDRDYQVPFMDRKDHSHANRLANYIDRVVFDSSRSVEEEKCEALFDLSYEDIFVLLCSIQLHDYGKVCWQLIYFTLIDTLAERDRAEIAEDFYDDAYRDPHNLTVDKADELNKRNLLEIHDKLKGIMSVYEPNYAKSQGLIENYHTENIRRYLDAIERNDKKAISFIRKLVRHEQNKTNLLDILLSIEPALICKIKNVCCAHKAFFPFLAAESKDMFASIPDESKFPAALLRLCDNLDMDKSRVAAPAERTLCQFLKDHLSSRNNDSAMETLSPDILHVMSIWTKFLLVKGIDIVHRGDANGKRHLDIILNYADFPSKDEYFFTLRYMTEKDFFSADFLEVIQDKHDNLKINLIYRVHPEITEGALEFTNLDDKDPLLKYFEKAKEDFKCKKADSNSAIAIDCSKQFIPIDFDLINAGREEQELLLLPYSFKTYFIIQTLRNKKLAKEVITRLYHIDEASWETLVKKFCDEDNQRFFLKRIDGLESLFRIANANPIVVKSKINELENCGKLFPFTRDSQPGVSTGISGLDEILSYGGTDPGEIRHSRNIIIKGGPGTGKTTLALQIFHHNLNNTHRYVGKNPFYVTFDESPLRIEAECRHNYDWLINGGRIYHFPPSDDLIGSEKDVKIIAENICAKFMAIVNRYHTDILFVDSLSRLRYCINDDKVYGEAVRLIFEKIEQQHLTAFYLLEDDDHSYEEYACDGIVYLHSGKGLRFLEIRKLRDQGYAPGKHAFTILNRQQIKQAEAAGQAWLEPGINVFPNIRMYLDKGGPNIDPEKLKEPVESGIEGLDNLLPIKPGVSKGFLTGNVILVIGSPGCGKTIFGLHFIKKGIAKEDKGLWISFEGNRSDLKRTVHLFDDKSLGFNSMLEEKSAGNFLFHFFPTTQFIPEELLFSIKRLVSDHSKANIGGEIKRIVIDSVSEIEPLFDQPNAFKNFMTVLIQELRSMGITTVLLYRSAEFFGFQKQTKTAISSLVDTIISIKTYDFKNRIKKGLFVLKSRGREQFSNLQGMEILSDRGIVVSDKGWEMEGLLSGETGEIKEPHIFLKLFYENPAERKINRHLIEDFRNRYRKETSVFTCVQKSQIYSEFWSFKGNFGAGHANIRIVSLNKYMVEAFRESNRLHTLDSYFSSSLQNDIKSDVRWNKYINKDGHFDFLPSYSDFGVLVFQKHLLEDTIYKDSITNKKQLDLQTISWDNLLHFSSRICLLLGEKKPEIKCYPFAMPPLDNIPEFVAFFMEILWSYGGDIFSLPPFSDSLDRYGKRRLLFYKKLIFLNKSLREEAIEVATKYDVEAKRKKNPPVLPAIQKTIDDYDVNFDDDNVLRINDDDDSAIKALTFLYEIVFEKKLCPNPTLGDMRPHALTSRKWYSEVQEFRHHIAAIKNGAEAENQHIHDRDGVHLSDERRKNFQQRPFEIFKKIPLELHKLPFVEETKKSVTNQGVWCLSIIREALSPEIGWIFIDSIVSPTITRMRAVERLGFPIKIEDIESENYNRFDKEIYESVASIMKTDTHLDNITDACAIVRYLHTEKDDFVTALNKLKEYGCDRSVIRPLISKLRADLDVVQNNSKLYRLIEAHDHNKLQMITGILDEAIFKQGRYRGEIKDKVHGYLVRRLFKKKHYEWTEESNSGKHRDKLFELLKDIKPEELKNFLASETARITDRIELLENHLKSITDTHYSGSTSTFKAPDSNSVAHDIDGEQQHVLYCSKLSANRPYFYRIEPVLHKHIKRMFQSSDAKRTKGGKEDFIKGILRDMRRDIILEIFRNPS